MAIVERIREQILALYKDDGSLIMQNLRKLVDGIDNYIQREKDTENPLVAMQVMKEYDCLIQNAMTEFTSYEVDTSDDNTSIRDVINCSLKAQEVLSLVNMLLHYIQYSIDNSLKGLSPDRLKHYRMQFSSRITQLEDISRKYQTIISNMSKILDYKTAVIQYKTKVG